MRNKFKNHIFKYLLLVFTLGGGILTCCTTKKADQPIRPSDQLQLSFPPSGSKIKAIPAEGANFFIKLYSQGSWRLSVEPSDASSWLQLEQSKGEGSQGLRIAISISENLGATREAKIIASHSRARRLALIILRTPLGRISSATSPSSKLLRSVAVVTTTTSRTEPTVSSTIPSSMMSRSYTLASSASPSTK